METVVPKNVIDNYLEQIEVTDLNRASIRQVLACVANAETDPLNAGNILKHTKNIQKGSTVMQITTIA